MLRRFRWKLFALMALIVLVASILSAGVASVLIRRETEDVMASELEGNSILFRHILATADASEIDPLCKRLGSRLKVRFTVIAGDGRVLGDSHADPATMENHGRRPEVVAALGEDRYGRETRLSATEKLDNLYVAVPLDAERPEEGVVRTAVSLRQVGEATARAHEIIGLAALFALGIALILAFWGSRRLTRPITQMTAFARRMAAGDFDGTLPSRADDEIGLLGQTLGRMRDQLREKIDALEAERGRLETILGGMMEGVVATDPDLSVVFANPAASRFLDLPSARMAGKSLHEISRSPELHDLVARAAQSGEAHTQEIVLGEIITAIYIAPIRRGDGTPLGMICVLHDVTELRNLEQMRIEFVANASHELKTPLSSIIGALETLSDGALSDPEACGRFMAIAESNSRRLHSLVRDLLDLSRIESPDFHPELSEVRMTACFDRAVAPFADRLAQKRQQLTVQVEPPDMVVLLDEDLLDQALYNLIDNSIKYTPEGGQITLATERQGEELVLEVHDSGIGIPRKELPRLFERFYRVDKARSRELGGTGLGLAIVKHVAIAHGGRVEAESEPGHGTTIRIVLPIAPTPSR